MVRTRTARRIKRRKRIMVRVVCLLIGYVFGLFQTSYFISKSRGFDIRDFGSGNAGTTNVFRTIGMKPGLMTFIGDSLKCLLAICLVAALGTNTTNLILAMSLARTPGFARMARGSALTVAGQEYIDLAQAVSMCAFEYGRLMLYKREQAILAEYIEKQYQLDEELTEKFGAFKAELKTDSDRFNELVDQAFEPGFRESLKSSVELAKAAGVKQEEILDSVEKIDSFFMD